MGMLFQFGALFTDLSVFESLGQPTVRIDVDRHKAARYGLSPGDVNTTVQAAIGGQTAGDLYEYGSDRHFPMRVRLAKEFRSSLATIRNISVGAQNPNGGVIPVPLSEISPNLVQAVIASEDQRYCLHNGVDWGALRDVVDDEDGPSRGASTLPMQTVKNLFLWHGRSYLRKALEVPLALYFDAVVPKKRILEIYLNIAEWGPGIYGAEAAAQYHFGVPAAKLSRRRRAHRPRSDGPRRSRPAAAR